MSNKDGPRLKPTSLIRKLTKTRTKNRKRKFLSLRLELSPEKKRPQMAKSTHQQLNLFPLQPENPVEDKETQDDHVAYLLEDGGADNLTTLLGVGSSSEDEVVLSAAAAASLTYSCGGQDREELVRTAMRSRERDASEEKWVCYSEVVERREEEVTSCAADQMCKVETGGLSLKLDYQKILSAWSGKGPFFVHDPESPQIVPDVHRDDFLSHDFFNVNGGKDGWGNNNGGLWEVPQQSIKVKGGGGEWKLGQREASVLRYKEKRQSRLFAKRIRYEVRKINAEKRPRMKGRFVKRS
ncbi:hypothetical protein NMG60_11006753 [Bertholletia excelsa]